MTNYRMTMGAAYRFAACILVATVGTPISNMLGLASKALADEVPPTSVTLTIDGSTYKLGGTIIIRVSLTNDSEQPVYIYSPLDWGESASVSIWIKDKRSGAQIPETFISDTVSPPPGSKDSFIKLLPHHIYGVEFKSKLAELGLRKKGVYELIAEYHSPVPANSSFGLPILTREQGSHRSNEVTIEVTD